MAETFGCYVPIDVPVSPCHRATNFRNDRSKAVARNKGKDHRNKCQFHRDRFMGHGMTSMRSYPRRQNPNVLKKFPHQASNRTEKTQGHCPGLIFVFSVNYALKALAFFFLRHPSRPNAPRPVAKSGRVAETTSRRSLRNSIRCFDQAIAGDPDAAGPASAIQRPIIGGLLQSFLIFRFGAICPGNFICLSSLA